MTFPSTGVVRATSGVRTVTEPEVRWDPGARYRASRLARSPRPETCAVVTRTPDPLPGWTLKGRLFRGPARRTAVFERPVWQPHPHRSGPATAISDAVARYRAGTLDTAGLAQAVGRALTR